jgi:hypothetical protein
MNQQQPQQDMQQQQQKIPMSPHPIGPTSIEGVEARDFPDGGRGSVDTDQAKVRARKTPMQTGETAGDVGLRGTPDVADAYDHGGRKHN